MFLKSSKIQYRNRFLRMRKIATPRKEIVVTAKNTFPVLLQINPCSENINKIDFMHDKQEL